MARWFRSHSAKLDNPKVQSDTLYRAWDGLLCVAARYDGVWRRSVDAVPEVRRALETIALEVADAAAWRENSKPIALSDKQRRLAEQRAISLQRCVEFGPVSQVDAEAWRAQISTIAARCNVATTLEEWRA
jgi:hypothetical protein